MLGLAQLAGMGLGGGALPPRSPLSPEPPPDPSSIIAELLARLRQPQEPLPGSFRELPEEARRPANREGLLALAAAIGGSPPGYLGSGLAEGAFARSRIQDAAFQDHRTRALADQDRERRGLLEQVELVGLEEKLAEARTEKERQRVVKAALADYAGSLRSLIPEDDPRRQEVEVALQTGDFARLAKLRDELEEDEESEEEEAERESWMLANGLDPNDPSAVELYEYERKKQLDSRYRPPREPAAPREGQVITSETGELLLVDQVTGEARPITSGGRGVRARSGKATGEPMDQLREDAYQDAQEELESLAREDPLGAEEFDFDAAFQRHLNRRSRHLYEPRGSNLPARDTSAAGARVGRIHVKTHPGARSPIEDAEGAPVSPAGGTVRPRRGTSGTYGGMSQGSADEVLRRLPFRLPAQDPESGESTRALIEQELAGGRSVEEIVAELVALAEAAQAGGGL